jgi:hypothetical protein
MRLLRDVMIDDQVLVGLRQWQVADVAMSRGRGCRKLLYGSIRGYPNCICSMYMFGRRR